MRRKSSNPALLSPHRASPGILDPKPRSQLRRRADVLLLQSQAEADRKSAGCITCHTATDSATMHSTGTVRLGCTDCHGGNSEIRLTADAPKDSAEYAQAKREAHPQPRNPDNSRTLRQSRRAPTPSGSTKIGTTSASSIPETCASRRKPVAPAAVTPPKSEKFKPA